MDYKLLKQSVLTVAATAVFAFLVVQALIWIVANFSGQVLAGLLIFALLGFMVAIDYERRKFLKACGK